MTKTKLTQTIDWQVTRRDFLKVSASVWAGLSSGSFAQSTGPVTCHFGMVTDAHYADVDTAGSRHYRDSLAKMTECVSLMKEKRVDFLVELGDFKDQGRPAEEKKTLAYLRRIEKVYQTFAGPCYHVLGNHDADSLSKTQFQSAIKNTGIAPAATYYAFDRKGIHYVVLDANFQGDGSDYDHGNFNWTDANIPSKELDWLRQDLTATRKPVILFVHQQLDGTGSHCIKNAAQVRQVLQESKRVLAVFQGHNHAGQYHSIEGIHYYTLKALIEGPGRVNNAYATVTVDPALNILVTGYRKAQSMELEKQI